MSNHQFTQNLQEKSGMIDELMLDKIFISRGNRHSEECFSFERSNLLMSESVHWRNQAAWSQIRLIIFQRFCWFQFFCYSSCKVLLRNQKKEEKIGLWPRLQMVFTNIYSETNLIKATFHTLPPWDQVSLKSWNAWKPT